MKKLMSLVGVALCLCFTALAERVTVDLSFSCSTTNDTQVYVDGAVASITNYAKLDAILVTVPATNSATLRIKMDVPGGSSEVGQPIYLVNPTTTPIVRYITPSTSKAAGGIPVNLNPFVVWSTNTSMVIKQDVKKTATWPVKLFIEQ